MGNNLIKLVKRKRKRSNLSDNQHSMTPAIFKLNGHCLNELFDYLSLRDLHSLGQTCKSMQQLTGEYFTRNYSATKFHCLSDGIYMIDTDAGVSVSIYKCVAISGFNEFINWIAIENNVVKREYMLYYPENTCYRFGIIRWPKPETWKRWKHEKILKDHLHCYLSKFEYFKLHSDEFKLVKKLTLTSLRLSKRLVSYILKILPNIEVLELINCTVTQDFYDILLKYCENVRNILLTHVIFKSAYEYKWLLHLYEKLEHLELGVDTRKRIDELPTFFNLNSNVRSFSCDSKTLKSNKDALLNAKVKLDTFELRSAGNETDFGVVVWDLLYQLHTHGFYKRLHINTMANFPYNRPSVPFLEQLTLTDAGAANFKPLTTHLIEFGEFFLPFEDAMESGKSRNETLAEYLMNVERLYLCRKELDILLFIKKLRNLKKIKLHYFQSAEILQLDLLNTEREKLTGAQKVTIYVPDAVFLATKWATKNGTTNFSLIKMKRAHSYEWNRSVYGSLVELRLPPGIK